MFPIATFELKSSLYGYMDPSGVFLAVAILLHGCRFLNTWDSCFGHFAVQFRCGRHLCLSWSLECEVQVGEVPELVPVVVRRNRSSLTKASSVKILILDPEPSNLEAIGRCLVIMWICSMNLPSELPFHAVWGGYLGLWYSELLYRFWAKT